MILCKYEKKDAAVYTPHLSLMRGFTMAIRRAALTVRCSEGFNPHGRIFFAPPLPVGTASECEYFAADSPDSPEVFMEKLNGSLQPGIKILKAARHSDNPNFAAVSQTAEYEIILEKSVKLPDFSEILTQNRYEISYEQKGETVTKDVRGLIFNLTSKGGEFAVPTPPLTPHSSLLTPHPSPLTPHSIYLTLACGNPNLRADRLVSHLLKSVNAQDIYFTVTKKRLFAKNFADIDSLFFMNI